MIEMRKEGQALHEAEKKLTERAKIHAVKDTKHKEATTRIAADVCYHKNRYPAFTGGAWHREENVEEADNKPDFPVIEIEQLFDPVENHIICGRWVYTVCQLRRFYGYMFGRSKRSIDVKAMSEDRFGHKLVYGKPVEFCQQ